LRIYPVVVATVRATGFAQSHYSREKGGKNNVLDTSNGIGIEIDRKKICYYLGYGADYQPPARVSSLLIKPAYSYIIRDSVFDDSP